MVPIEYDEDGNILDGHHRVRACQELGIDVWPRLVRRDLTEEQKRAHARALNLARRHLSREQRKTMWVDMRQEGMSYRQIAEADGTVNKDTVQRAIESTVSNETVELPDTVKGKDGKKRQATKPKSVYVSAEDITKAKNERNNDASHPDRGRGAFEAGAVHCVRQNDPSR